MPSQKTKIIARNTGFLYLRMLLSMAVSLYTSRIVLQVLGVDDYGVYNVVGGIIAMFGFLNSSMGSATARFITFAIGKNNEPEVRRTFCTAILAHGFIALFIVIIGETVGLWYLNNKMVIPVEARTSAQWLYQFTILSSVISILQVPYNALIIAHERMSVYAYVEILNVFLKLGIVYLLVVVSMNKLVIYGLMTLTITILIFFIYRSYCLKQFKVSHFEFIWDKLKLKEMISFSSIDLYGNCSVIVRTTGISMLINLFFGVVANAALGISNQVQAAVNAFSSNVVSAVRPQIIKSYAKGEFAYMSTLILSLSKVSFIILSILIIPILIETKTILNLWLGEVPEYTIGFVHLTLLFQFFSTMSFIVVTGVHASGDIRWCNFVNGTLYMLTLPIAYVGYKYYHPFAGLPLLLNAIFCMVGCLVNVITVHYYVRVFSIKRYIGYIYLLCPIITYVCYAAIKYITSYISHDLVRLSTSILLSILFICAFAWLTILNKNEKNLVISLSKVFFKRQKQQFEHEQ